MNNSYWMHRITCGKNASPYARPLFFGTPGSDDHYISIGWSDFSHEYFVDAVLEDGMKALENLVTASYSGLGRNLYSLYRFIAQMKAGDIVVVPMWDTFSVCKIADDKVFTNQSIDLNLLIDGAGNRLALKVDDYLYDSDEKCVDMGFYRKVELIATNIPRSGYASQHLYSAMKSSGTNTCLSEEVAREVDAAVSDWMHKKPINLKAEIENTVAEPILGLIRTLQDMNFESLVEWYLKGIGAVVEKPAKNSCLTQGGYANLIAHFDAIETTVMVQVKKHEGNTGDWAVRQIASYAERGGIDDFMNQMWVVSTCEDYSEEAKQLAEEKGVRLITGLDFAKMILGVGIKSLTI